MSDRFDDPVAFEGHVPPSDVEAEGTVLKALMLDPEALADVEFLEPEHFFSEAHRRIFEAIRALSAAGQPTDAVRVAGWLSDAGRFEQVGGGEYITDLLNAALAVGGVRGYGLRVHALARVRKVQQRCLETHAEGYGAGQDASAFCERTAQAFHELAFIPGMGGELEPVGEPLREAFAELQAAQREGRSMVGLPTGLDRLDRILGGLHDGELTIVAARPGKGKSSAALQWAMHAARGEYPAAFFSLEMPRKQIAMRAACMLGRVDVSHWRTGQVTPAEWPRLTSACQQVDTMALHVDDTAGLTAMGLRSRLRRLDAKLARAGKGRVRLVVVDYLQLMRSTGVAHKQGREREVAEIAQDLKEIAKEFSVPVVAPCQMNRAIEQGTTRRPRLSDLRESGNIEQAADTVIFIHETKERDVVEFIVEKQRNGPNDIVTARFEREFTCFQNIDEAGYYPGDGGDQWAAQ